MAEQGWSLDLGRKLGLNGPVDFTARTDGHFTLHVPCSIDQKKHDFTIDKKLPPNVILKKLKQRDWDITKGRVRCPLCVHMKLKRRLVDTEAQPQLEVEEETFSLSKNDIRVETFRASGPGGQHVNTTDSAVRVTHIPTGMQATVQSHRSQHQNRQQALATLTERVKQYYDKKEVDVPRQEHPDDIRLGISPGSIVVTIPKSHELFSAFIGNDRKGNSHWKLELRSNPNLKGEPFIALVKTKLPPGKLRMRGLSVATYNRQTETAVLAIKPKLYPEIIQRFGTFRSAPAEIRHVSQRGIDLQLPPSDERKPVILRGESKRLEEETRPPEPVVEHVPTPVPEPEKHLPAELPVRRTEPALTAVPHLTMPRRMYLEPVQAPIDVERAINFLNDFKKKKGDDLRFRMEEGGYLSYIMKGGHR